MGSGSGSDFSPHSSTNAGLSDEASGSEGGSVGKEEERKEKRNLGLGEKDKE